MLEKQDRVAPKDWPERDSEEILTFSYDITNLSASATVGNTLGAALPHTGGPGTRLFTILGSILIAGAGLLL